MPEKLPDNIREALETDRTALQARIAAAPDGDERVEGWARRVSEVDAQLGVTPKAKAAKPKQEKRPASTSRAKTEKRPG